jgi:hypothetical protein
MNRWELGDAQKWIKSTLETDPVIRQKMGIDIGQPTPYARVSYARVPRDPIFPYIFFYYVSSNDARGQGRTRIQANPYFDIEVRTLGGPTANSEAIVNRIEGLLGNVCRTAYNGWVYSCTRMRPIDMTESGESNEVFYTRRGGTYWLSIVRGVD